MKKIVGEKRVRAELKLAGIVLSEDTLLHETTIKYVEIYKEGLVDYGYSSVEVHTDDEEISATVKL